MIDYRGRRFTPDPVYERLAYEAAQRALDKQERLIDELVAFLVAVGASLYVLLPKTEKFVFSLVGAGLYEGLYEVKDDLAEVYRRLAYDLDRFWDENDVALRQLARAFRVAAGALTAEIVVLIAMVSDTLL